MLGGLLVASCCPSSRKVAGPGFQAGRAFAEMPLQWGAHSHQAAQEDSTASEALDRSGRGLRPSLHSWPTSQRRELCLQKQLAQGRIEQGPAGSPSRPKLSLGLWSKTPGPCPSLPHSQRPQ